MGFLLSLAYNINRYMLEQKVLTNYYSASFYSFAGKIPCVFPIHSTRKSFRICRVGTKDDKNSQISEKEWFLKLLRKMGHAVFNKRKGFG